MSMKFLHLTKLTDQSTFLLCLLLEDLPAEGLNYIAVAGGELSEVVTRCLF